MISPAKILIPAAALVLLGFVGLHEYRTACAPKQPDAETQSHENGGGDTAHSAKGFMTEVCEEGLFTVLKERSGLAAPPVAMKADAKAKPSKPEHDSRDEKESEKEGKTKEEHEHGKGLSDGEHGEGGKGIVKLSSAQLQAAGIDMAPVTSGTLLKEISVPGRIAINANAQAKVVPKLPGTVAKVMKQVGDAVSQGEILAILESREMSDAKGDYLATSRSEELAKSTFSREERLWKQKVTAEQDYLSAKNAHQEAVIKRDLAHQRLHTVGMSEAEILALPKGSSEADYRFYELRAPISGRVLSRDIVMGQIVGTDRETFSIADLSTVWIEMSVAPADLSFAKERQEVRVGPSGKSAIGKVVAVSPAIDPETRGAKVIAELENRSGEWHLGDFVNAQLLSGKLEVALLVPRDALQTIKGSRSVFVNEGAGFKVRAVITGREDSANVEILAGLEFGETIAIKNTFTLKAELGKAEADHDE